MVWKDISFFSKFWQWSQKNTLNIEFDVSYKKPLTHVTGILLTHRIVGLKPNSLSNGVAIKEGNQTKLKLINKYVCIRIDKESTIFLISVTINIRYHSKLPIILPTRYSFWSVFKMWHLWHNRKFSCQNNPSHDHIFHLIFRQKMYHIISILYFVHSICMYNCYKNGKVIERWFIWNDSIWSKHIFKTQSKLLPVSYQ